MKLFRIWNDLFVQHNGMESSPKEHSYYFAPAFSQTFSKLYKIQSEKEGAEKFFFRFFSQKSLEPFAECKKQQKKVPDQLLVCGIEDL